MASARVGTVFYVTMEQTATYVSTDRGRGTEPETATDRRFGPVTHPDSRYERVIEVIAHETGDSRATVEKDRLLYELQRIDVEEAERVLSDALKNGDLERRGRGYCLPFD